MQTKSRCFLLLLTLLASVSRAADLPRSEPEAQGASSPDLLAFVDMLDHVDTMNSFMLVRHGHVVAEGWWTPYRADARHSLYSLSKSFTSTAVGLAIRDQKLRLDDEILKFFPDDAPAEPSDNLKAMRVSDLLRMSTGQQSEPPRTADEPWTKTFLNHPVPFKPGTHFLYNTSATYMQSAIVQKATGQTVLEYLGPRLFQPLGIENPTWEASPQGVSTGGYGLSVRTEDIAKFGQLYLQHGQWNGKQIVPPEWIEAATSLQTSNGSNPNSDWDQGYGYQFWRCRHGAYRGDGAFGQYCIVLPEQDAVVVITSGVRDMQSVLNLVWDELLPALKPAPLPTNAEAAAKLEGRLQYLTVRLPNNDSEPAPISGKKYVFPTNDLKLNSLSVQHVPAEGVNVATVEPLPAEGVEVLTVEIDGTERRIVCGRNAWRDGRFGWGDLARQPVGAASGWSNDVLTVKLCFYETPFIVTLQMKFADDKVTLNAERNVGFGPTRQPELIGVAQ